MRVFFLRIGFLAAFLFVAPSYVMGAQALQAVLTELQHRTERIVTLRSDFVQETDIPMFATPMVSHGRLLFRRPDALRWEYLDPMKEGFVLVGKTGFRWEEERRSPFTPGGDPMVMFLAGQLAIWLTFDRERIERVYKIEALSSEPICLKMTPLSETAGNVITAITIVFAADGAASLVRLDESLGGHTTLTFSNTVLNQPFDNKEFQ